MKREKILTLVLAGGAGARLDALTEQCAKPALPFGGALRLIDFALSNCLHSGLHDVWIIEQYDLHSLNDHLANGRPWDLDRTHGGLRVLPPFTKHGDEDGDGDDRQSGFAQGNADAIYRQRQLIKEFAPDLLLVLSADHIYKLDYRDVIDRHREAQADVTMVTTRVPPGDKAERFGVVRVDDSGSGRVVDFAYKPKKPQGDLVTAEVFVYDAPKLLRTLDEMADKGGELKDYGNELLPRLVRAGRAYEFRLNSYWRDVGTLESYWQAHMDLLQQKSELALDDPSWPILTQAEQKLPAHILGGAQIENSLIAPGCTVAGRVSQSVLASDVKIEPGATVRDSVLLRGVKVEKGACIERAIVDEGAVIGAEAVVGGEELSVIGRGVVVAQRSIVASGARLRTEGPGDS